MTTFDQALRAAGLRPRDVVPDGKWRRCATDDKPKKRNGAYVLHPDGRGYWRNWATDSELNEWRDEVAYAAARVDPAKLEAQRQAERLARHRAIDAARAHWHGAKLLSALHPYIERKGLTPLGCAGLRVDQQGWLVVPVMWRSSLISVQRINPAGDKRFWPGAPVKGGAFLLTRSNAAVTCLVEGLATGLAVYQSVRQASVIVCFDAGNLLPVAERLKPHGSVVVCADNDHGTQAKRGFNPGIDKAGNVADLLGCGVAFPTGIEGTDWADALKEWGEGASRRIERLILAQARYVMAEAAPP